MFNGATRLETGTLFANRVANTIALLNAVSEKAVFIVATGTARCFASPRILLNDLGSKGQFRPLQYCIVSIYISYALSS